MRDKLPGALSRPLASRADWGRWGQGGTFGPSLLRRTAYTDKMTGVVEVAVPNVAFEGRLREVLRSRVEFIELIGDDLVAAGGKRTRPLIAFLAAQVLGAHPGRGNWNEVVDVGVCIELLHSASLLHDDLIDDADTRRGKPSAFRRFGNVVSVMSGDFMLARLLMLLSSLPGGAALIRAFGRYGQRDL